MPKQAIILSAGFGTRMGELTANIPKVMIPIAGRPLLEHNIEQFKRHGINEFFINLHYLPEKIYEYFGDGSKWGVKINYSFEPVILGTAGGMKQFENKLDNDFFLIYGDIFSLVDYTKMYVFFKKKKNAIGIQRTQKTDFYEDADVAELDINGKFISIHPKPHIKKYKDAHRMRGIFIFNKDVFKYIPQNIPYEIGKQLLPNLITAGKNFYSYECEDFSKGIDTVEKYKKIQEDFLNL